VEFDGAGNYRAWNLYGAKADEVLARWVSGVGNLWYHSDSHGNVFALLNNSAGVMERYSYDAFGKPKITGWTDEIDRGSGWYGNRFMFQGREWIPDLGIYDYRHRIYHPGLGRFLQSDPMGLQTDGAKLTPEQKALYGAGAPEAFGSSEMNLFRYCGDDPVDKSDALGLEGEVYVYRVDGRASLDNDVSLYENGRYLASFRGNENGFIGDARGPRAGNYVLLPKGDAKPGEFPKGTPSITAPRYADPNSSEYAPGRAGPDYKADGTVRVHNRSPDGSPDSTGCLTGSPGGVGATKNLMDRNLNNGGTRVHFLDRIKSIDGHEVRRAIRVNERRYQ